MKRFFFRDVARNFRSHDKFRYAIAVARKLGGDLPRECNLCGYRGLFHATDHPPRYDCVCLKCGSEERHRLLGLLLAKESSLGSGSVVHFAPIGEGVIAELLRKRSHSYRSADRSLPECDSRIDIEAMDLPSASVDLFVVNHVLEHVDDRRALSELYRCLAPGGRVLITVPLIEGWAKTYENEMIAKGPSDRERALHFGHGDHVRYYGADLRSRITAAGFKLSTFTASPEEVLRHGLIAGETVFTAIK